MEFISIQSFLYVVFSYLVTYFIGHIAIAFLRIPDKYPFFKEFSKLVIASFLIVTGYSVYKTSGITINTGIVFLVVFFLFWCKKENYLHTKREVITNVFNKRFFAYLLIQIILLFFIFIFLLWHIKNPTTNEIYEVFGDFYNYSKNIQHLNKTGIEAIFTDWYSGIPSDRSLYHFGELWQSAFYSTITNQVPFSAFYFQLFALYLVVYIIGGCALIEVFIQPKNKLFYCISVFIIIACGISFYIPSNTIFTKGDWWSISLTFQPKYFFPTIFVFYAILLTKFNKIIPLLLLSVACLFACSVIAPAALLFIGFTLLSLFISKKINLSTFIRHAGIPLFAIAFIGSYYLLIDYLNNKNAIAVNVISTTSHAFSWLVYLKTAFNCFAGQLIKSALSLLFFLIVFFVIIRTESKEEDNIKNIFAVIIIIHIASLLSYALFHNRVDAVQLWTNIYLPLSAVVGFMAIAYLINSKTRILSLIAILLIVLCLIQARPFQRFQKINQEYTKQLFQKYDGGVSVFYKSEKDFSSVFSKNVNLYSPSAFLIMKYKEYNPVCLSVLDIPISKKKLLHDAEENIIQNSVFYKFIQVQKKNNKFVSPEQSQLDFMQQYKVKSVFTYLHSALPDTLQSLVLTSVTDSINGITFYQLK